MHAVDGNEQIPSPGGTTLRLGECPIWNDGLYWVDLRGGRLFHAIMNETGWSEQVVWQGEGVLSAIIPTIDGGFIGCSGHELIHIVRKHRDLEPDEWYEVDRLHLPIDEGLRVSDAIAGLHGELWLGIVDETGRCVGTLSMIDALGHYTAIDDDIAFANGLDFSPAGTTLYFIDSNRSAIYSYDYERLLSGYCDRKLVCSLLAYDGKPDGMSVDANGTLWVALFGGGGILHITSAGEFLEFIDLPVHNVSSCAFDGSQAGVLWATTASEGLPKTDRAWPNGAIFRMAVDGSAVAGTRRACCSWSDDEVFGIDPNGFSHVQASA